MDRLKYCLNQYIIRKTYFISLRNTCVAEDIPGKNTAEKALVSDVNRTLVEGWSFDGQDLDDLIGDEIPEAFDSREEVAEFVRGRGEYSDRNSFSYGPMDALEMKEEGYFLEFECHLCLREGDDNPELISDFKRVEKQSFRPEHDKFRDFLWYRCEDHGPVYIVEDETLYEEK